VDVDRDKYRDKYDPRQRHPGEDASTEMKTNVDMFEVPRSGGKGSPKGDKNPGHEEHNRFEALRSFSHRDDIPPGRPEFSPLEPTTPRSGGVSTYENDNAIDRQPDQRLGSTDDVADRRVQLPQPERNNVTLLLNYLFFLDTDCSRSSQDVEKMFPLGLLHDLLARTIYRLGYEMGTRRQLQPLTSPSLLNPQRVVQMRLVQFRRRLSRQGIYRRGRSVTNGCLSCLAFIGL